MQQVLLPTRASAMPVSGSIQTTVTAPDLRPLRTALCSDTTLVESTISVSAHPASDQLARPLTLAQWVSSDAAIASSQSVTTFGNTDSAVMQAASLSGQVDADNQSGLRSRNLKSALLSPALVFAPVMYDPESSQKQYWSRTKLIYHDTLRGVKKYGTFILLIFLAAIVGTSIGIGWSLRLRTSDGLGDNDLVSYAALHNYTNFWLTLNATLVNIDPSMQVMTLDWQIDGVSKLHGLVDCVEDPSCPDVNLYFDQNLLATTSFPASNIIGPRPVFTLNGTNWLSLNKSTDERPNTARFRTDVLIFNAGPERTVQSYPFDKYNAKLAMFAMTIPDNQTVGIFVGSTSGIAVGYNAELTDSGVTPDNMTYIKDIEITRGLVIRIYAIFIVIAIWMVTLTFVVAGVAVVVLGKGIRAEVLVLPIATLFAFTQLRGTLPGAPTGFGADIDFVGILPCLALLTLCSVFMTAIFLFRNPEQNSKTYEVLFTDKSTGQVAFAVGGRDKSV
ncbi:hypothetical protein CERSUDRAFT_114025 [Gelatoporia subvermispora B]|uniref:Uncharacterized protein n=1 Tax=Ceriporiopsis subvermispora (strain B) TaxID=914234 RepID=M2QJZ5_CERS8|nr:hypothetical protein CERSUDRAFT_114025 [Gelatoporia subvermispora B]